MHLISSAEPGLRFSGNEVQMSGCIPEHPSVIFNISHCVWELKIFRPNEGHTCKKMHIKGNVHPNFRLFLGATIMKRLFVQQMHTLIPIKFIQFSF